MFTMGLQGMTARVNQPHPHLLTGITDNKMMVITTVKGKLSPDNHFMKEGNS